MSAVSRTRAWSMVDAAPTFEGDILASRQVELCRDAQTELIDDRVRSPCVAYGRDRSTIRPAGVASVCSCRNPAASDSEMRSSTVNPKDAPTPR